MLRSLWDRAFGDPWAGWSDPFGEEAFQSFWEGGDVSTTYPPLNLSEDDERFLLEAELPGLTMSDLEIVCQGRTLTLRGERKTPPESEGAYQRRERPMGPFVRTMTLPGDVDIDQGEATLRDGVLLVTLPKTAQAKARRIEVKPAEARGKKEA